MVGVDVVVGAALLKAVAVEADHTCPAFADVAVHFFGVFVVWARGIASVVVGIVPHITGTSQHAVIMEIDISGKASEASELACAVAARRFAGIAGDSLIRIGGCRAFKQTRMVVEIAANAVEAVSAVDAARAVGGALSTVTIGSVDCVVENGTGCEAEPVELDETSVANEAILGRTAGQTVGLTGHAIIVICACLQTLIVGLWTSEQTGVIEDIIARTAL